MMAQPRPRNEAATIPSSNIGAIPPLNRRGNAGARRVSAQPQLVMNVERTTARSVRAKRREGRGRNVEFLRLTRSPLTSAEPRRRIPAPLEGAYKGGRAHDRS